MRHDRASIFFNRKDGRPTYENNIGNYHDDNYHKGSRVGSKTGTDDPEYHKYLAIQRSTKEQHVTNCRLNPKYDDHEEIGINQTAQNQSQMSVREILVRHNETNNDNNTLMSADVLA